MKVLKFWSQLGHSKCHIYLMYQVHKDEITCGTSWLEVVSIPPKLKSSHKNTPTIKNINHQKEKEETKKVITHLNTDSGLKVQNRLTFESFTYHTSLSLKPSIQMMETIKKKTLLETRKKQIPLTRI